MVLESGAGLRERKKQRTRSTLIDAAVELCERQGFDATTVEQIAAVADVSPRTFSRYFSTKDAVILALVDDMSAAVAVHLAHQPAELGELDALFGAHIDMMRATEHSGPDGFGTDKLITLGRIVTSSSALRLVATEFREHAMAVALAERMGVCLADRRLHLAITVWSAILGTTFDLLRPRFQRPGLTIEEMVGCLRETYAQFKGICATAG